jgi:hypothetical protein
MHIYFRTASAVFAAAALLAGCGGAGGDAAPGQAAAKHAAAGAGSGGGPRLVAVPSVVGRRQEVAHRIAAQAGMSLRWAGFAGKAANGRYPIGCVKVLSQSPVAGERRPRGAQITVIEIACRTPRSAPHGTTWNETTAPRTSSARSR